MSEPNTFKCEACQKVFETDDSDERSIEEFENTFGENVDELGGVDALASLCDDCYAKFMKWFKANRVN